MDIAYHFQLHSESRHSEIGKGHSQAPLSTSTQNSSSSSSGRKESSSLEAVSSGPESFCCTLAMIAQGARRYRWHTCLFTSRAKSFLSEPLRASALRLDAPRILSHQPRVLCEVYHESGRQPTPELSSLVNIKAYQLLIVTPTIVS
jgi:hypothetical protein